MTEIYGTFVGRWYVTVLGAVFAVAAARHMGWRKTVIYAVAAVGVGIAFENASVHAGFPYTRYAFNARLRGKEIFAGDVPLMVPLSYTFLGYLAFASGRIVTSGPRRTRASRAWHEALAGVLLSVWALWIYDPVARLGSRWFLGELFRYDGPGFWFGLPLASQLGFTLTAAILVGLLMFMMRDEPDRPVARTIVHPHLLSLVTYNAVILWLAVVAVVLRATEIGGAALVMWAPAAALTAVLWSVKRAEVAG